MTEERSSSESGGKRGRRWLRWLALSVLVALLLAVLFVLALPALLTSGFATKRYESIASDAVGRPVELDGLRFGWMTELKIGRIGLPATTGEHGHPAAIVEDVSVPLSLIGIIQGDWRDPGEISIRRLEANLVRREDGEWNWLALAERLATDEEPEPKVVDPDAEPFVLPLDRFSYRIEGIALRVIDPEADLRAGWEDGYFRGSWPGGTSPVALEAGGVLRLNDNTMPWDLSAYLAYLIDSGGTVTPERVRATVALPASAESADDVAEGGLFVFFPMTEGDEAVVRLALPLEKWSAFARGWEGADAVPDLNGLLDLQVALTHRRDFEDLDFRVSLDGHALEGDFGELLGTELPPQDLALAVAGKIDLAAGLAEQVEASLQHEALRLDARAARVPLDDATQAEGIDAELAIGFEAASALASRFSGGDGEALLDGSLRLAVRQTAAFGAAVELDFLPGTLVSLEPFVEEHPEALRPLPLDLRPLALRVRAEAEGDEELDAWTVSRFDVEGALIESLRLNGGTTLSTGAWEGGTEVVLDLARLLEVAGAFAELEDLPRIAGRLTLEANGSSSSPGRIETTGALALRELSVSGEDLPFGVAEDEIRLEWDVAALPEEGAAELHRVALLTSFADLELSGAGGTEELDLQLLLALHLARIGELAEPFLPPDAKLHGGEIELALEVSGRLNDALDVALAVSSPEAPRFEQEGLVRFNHPVEAVLQARVEWEDEALARIIYALEAFSIGAAMEVSSEGEIDLLDGDLSTAALHLFVDYAEVPGFLDPAFFEEMELELALEGATELFLETVFALGPNGDGEGTTLAGPLELHGEVITELPSILWAFGELDGYVEDLFDEREFRLAFDPDDPDALDFLTEAISGFGLVDGPMGARLEAMETAWGAQWTGAEGLVLEVASLSVASTRYEAEGLAVALPELVLGLVATAPSDFSRFDLEQFFFEAQGLVELEALAAVDIEGGTWDAEALITVPDLRTPLVYLPDDAELPEMRGGVRFSALLSGTIPDEEADAPPAEGLPVSGTLFVELLDFDLEGEEGMAVQGLTAFVEVLLPDGPGPIEVVTDATIVQFVQPVFAAKPPRNIRWRATTLIDEMERVDALIEELSVENYGVSGGGFLSIEGLADALADETTEGLERWLDHLFVDGELRVQQDLDGWTGFLDVLAMSGIADFTARLTSRPQSSLRLNTLVDLQDASMAFGNLMNVQGLEGSWEAAKTLRLSPAARVEPAPPAGRFTVRRLSLGPPGLEMVARRSTITARGFDGGFGLEMESRDLMGGSATGGLTGAVRGGDPFLAGRFIFTGFDAGLLGGGIREARHDPDWELNGAATMQWRMRPSTGDRFLEDMVLDVRSTRVGPDALARLLRTLDRDADDPRFQNAIVALSFGTPRSFSVQMDGAMVSMRSELGLRGGVRVPLPILDRQPLGEVLEVYRLDEFGPLIELTRVGLLLLFAPDLETVERILAERAQQ